MTKVIKIPQPENGLATESTLNDLLVELQGGIDVTLPGGTQNPGYVRVVGVAPSVIPSGATEVSVMNIGNNNITVNTGSGPVVLDKGVGLDFRASEGKTLDSFTFTGSTITSVYLYTTVV